VNRATYEGWSPLVTAAWQGNADIAQTLLEAGAELNAPNASGRTPACCAANRGHVAVLSLLIGAKANLNSGARGRTALNDAARCGRLQTVSLLLQAKANVTRADENGETPLAHAVCGGNSDVVALLLEAKAAGGAGTQRN
jgi:ankyrin repeat protein